MIDKRIRKRHKLSHEILGLTGISGAFSVIVFWLLYACANLIVDSYCYEKDLVLTDQQWQIMNTGVISLSMLLSVGFFAVLFLFLLGDRLSYIRKLTKGIDGLGMDTAPVGLEGNNELTELAQQINRVSEARRQLREKELQISREKEQFIRTLSHDIRTPLTSILAYSDYLSTQEQITQEERDNYYRLIRRKAQQIREMTDILLDGGKRNPEYFENARLLMQQLAGEFEESLEAQFTTTTDLSGCPVFSGSFDVRELRRIFDNLSSNVLKYAAPEHPVSLRIGLEEGQLVITQSNAVGQTESVQDSYQLGLRSIQRIAQHYDGQSQTRQEGDTFAITITLSQF